MNLIQIKYSPEDEVYKIHKDTIVKGKIETIKIIATFESTTILYEIAISGKRAITCKEDEIAKDIDSLLETLKARALEIV